MKNFLLVIVLVYFGTNLSIFGQSTFHEVPGTNPSESSFAGLNPFSKNNSNRVRILLRSTELTSTSPTIMGAGDIASIGFMWKAAPGSNSVENVTIRIKQTTDTDIGVSQPIGGFKSEIFQDVFSGDLTNITVDDWIQIPFDAPFSWDGTSNILIEICKPSGDTGAGYIYTHTSIGPYNTRRSTTSGGCSAEEGAMNYESRARIRFEMLGTGCQAPEVTINGTAEICTGETTVLTAVATTSEGTIESYLWFENGNPMTETGETIEVTGAGTYSVEVTNSTGCSAVSNEITVVENALPIITISDVDPLCVGDNTIAIKVNPEGGVFSGMNLVDSLFTPSTEGDFEITYSFTDANGCSNSESITITVEECDNVSISKIEGVEFKLYPNPSVGELIIEASNIQKEATVEVTSLVGQKVYTSALDNEKTHLDLSMLPSGTYLVHIKNGLTTSVYKLVKK